MDVREFISTSFKTGRFEFSEHALYRGIQRKISLTEILESIENFKIIEDYPMDKFSPSCLILGYTKKSKPLHIQLTTDTSNILKIVTVYEPDAAKWDKIFKERR